MLLFIVALVGVVIAIATLDRWLFTVLDPGPFDSAATPSAPDYEQPEAWAALPELEDGADVALPSHPSIDQASAPADVFYLHPTTWVGSTWNGPLDDPAVIEATTRGGTLIQASVFNACCAVFAPRYRQANGKAYVEPGADGQQAIDVAFTDVAAAFDRFLERTADRPFILAGHSQGAVLGARLLRERIVGHDVAARLVVAYLPGAPIRTETFGDELPRCDDPTQTGCIAAWNARGPDYEPNGLEFDSHRPDPMAERLCVNPISWRADGAHVPAEQHGGAVFFDTPTPAVQPAFADAQCEDGSLVITAMGDPQRDLASTILLWTMGPDNFHPIEYQLYYLDLRDNAVARVDAFLGR